jgi:DNA gyrase inhibitor GyrI
MPGLAKVVHGTTTPLAPCESRRVTMSIFHSSEQDTLSSTSLISKQVVPYRTQGGTCCLGVSTHKARSLADSSMTIHNTWWNPTISTIPTHAQTTVSILTMVTSHHDRWKTNTQHSTQAKLNITNMERLVWWLKTTGLSNTTNHKNPMLKYKCLGNQLMHAAGVY